jgi:hypothetical protein
VLCKENRALLAGNERLEDLVELAMAANDRNNGVIRQYQSVLMHYNELQSRSAGVEEIYMKSEQKVADEVAKAGFRQKPGPKKGSSIQKRVPKISRRGKTNHSDWNTGMHKKIPRRKVSKSNGATAGAQKRRQTQFINGDGVVNRK